jgi:hypothetical protein
MKDGSDKQTADAVEQTVTDELAAAEAGAPESDADALVRLRAVEARVREELARYGILSIDNPLLIGAGGVSILLRHIYNNRDATYGFKNLTIEILESQLNALTAALSAAFEAAGQSAEQAHATVDELLRDAVQLSKKSDAQDQPPIDSALPSSHE